MKRQECLACGWCVRINECWTVPSLAGILPASQFSENGNAAEIRGLLPGISSSGQADRYLDLLSNRLAPQWRDSIAVRLWGRG